MKTIYIVGRFRNTRRHCATPKEAAESLVKELTVPERGSIKLSGLIKIIKAIRVNKDVRLFNITVTKATLFGDS